MKIIYDVGSNNGDDIPYYLMKADLVIAIEANPGLTGHIKYLYAEAIKAGRLVVESCVVTVAEPGEVPFYLHKIHHVLGQLPRPASAEIDQFDEFILPAKNILDIIKVYGDPFYIKLDLERYDQQVLRYLFGSKVFPPYISAEVHQAEVFGLLVGCEFYKSFKIIDGGLVPHTYQNHEIQSQNGPVLHSFPGHSAGPFGNDIKGPWLCANSLFGELARMQLGWRDVHASRVDLPTA